MILGYSHPNFELKDKEKLILYKMKVSHVEMRIISVELGSEIFDSNIVKSLKKLVDERFTLSIHCFPGINLGEKVGRIRKVAIEIVVDQLSFAERVNAKWLTLHLGSCGFASNSKQKKDRLNLVVRSIEEILQATKDYKVKIGIENLQVLSNQVHKCYIGDCLDDFVYLFEKLSDERVGIVFDIGHAVLNVREEHDSLEEFVDRFGDFIIAAHVHANDGLSDQHASISNSFIERYPSLRKTLSRLENSEIPLIVEHHDFNQAINSLSYLLQFKQENQ